MDINQLLRRIEKRADEEGVSPAECHSFNQHNDQHYLSWLFSDELIGPYEQGISAQQQEALEELNNELTEEFEF